MQKLEKAERVSGDKTNEEFDNFAFHIVPLAEAEASTTDKRKHHSIYGHPSNSAVS